MLRMQKTMSEDSFINLRIGLSLVKWTQDLLIGSVEKITEEEKCPRTYILNHIKTLICISLYFKDRSQIERK